MSEQRYQAVLAVLSDGETVTDVAGRVGVRRQTEQEWLARYEAGGLEALADRSHRPRSCPHQMPSVVEVMVLELRRAHPSWGPRRLHYELARRELDPLPSESAIYRCLVHTARSHRTGAGLGPSAGDDGSAPDPTSCGRWTPWPGSCSPTGPGPRR